MRDTVTNILKISCSCHSRPVLWFVYFFTCLDPVKAVLIDGRSDDLSYHYTENATCHAEGNPSPAYEWINTTDNSIVGYGRIFNVRNSTSTTFMCKAYNKVKGETYVVYSAKISFNSTGKLRPALFN